jgi:protein phosphatase
VASEDAKEYISEKLRELPDNSSPEEIAEAMEKAIVEASRKIFEKAEADRDRYEGMGTTATVVKVWEGGGKRKLIIGNVGDSRVYRLKANGSLEVITLDDGFFFADDQEEAKAIQERLSEITNLDELTEDERTCWNWRNKISQALGQEEITPHIEIVDIDSGDTILIPTDGIHDNLTHGEIEDILKGNSSSENPVPALIDAAQAVSRKDEKENPRAKQDDMTAIVVRF